jgi:di/tricarboxylate transporter
MSVELLSILVLVVVFLVATVLPINMGALALVAAYVVGVYVVDEGGVLEGEENLDAVVAGFPGDLFIILVGVTYLFALARDNGTVDWLVDVAVKSVGGRIALIPWVMFAVTGVLTAFGAVVPAAVAIIAPIAMGFGMRYGIRPLLMGLMVINGATAGGFSPLSIFGSIANGVVESRDLDGSPLLLFVSSLVFNTVLGLVTFVLFGGRELMGRRDQGETEAASAERAEEVKRGAAGSGATTAQAERTLVRNRTVTVVGMLGLAIGVLFFDMDIGFTAIALACVLSLLSPNLSKSAVAKIAWPTVLLICGIVTYVSLLENIGTVEWLGEKVANIGAPLAAALLICYIGGVVSAFASTTGILGTLIPLAVPFLLTGDVGTVGMIIALCISSSVVDSSPFSTSGALVVANTPEEHRDAVFRQLMIWGGSMVVLAPPVAWLIWVVIPGWL